MTEQDIQYYLYGRRSLDSKPVFWARLVYPPITEVQANKYIRNFSKYSYTEFIILPVVEHSALRDKNAGWFDAVTELNRYGRKQNGCSHYTYSENA